MIAQLELQLVQIIEQLQQPVAATAGSNRCEVGSGDSARDGVVISGGGGAKGH